MSIIPPNRLKSRLASGQLAVGTMLAEIRQPSVMQMLVNAGLDWVILDNEHGVFSDHNLADLARTARWLGLTPIVRVPALTYEQICHALDGGAQGVMLPRIRTADEVRFAVSCAKYPPEGARGSAMGRGHTDFKAGDVVAMMRDANAESFVIVQIETREALENLEAILAVPGVDCALIGPNDLAIALGVAGQMRSPVLDEAINRTLAACTERGIVPAIHTNDVALTGEWAKRGMRLVSISSEVGFMMKAAKEAADSIRSAAS